MVIQLAKGERFNLSQEAPNLKKIAVGLGWQVSQTASRYDIDASAFLLGADGKLPSEEHFIFYNNLNSPDRSVTHSGDNKTGQGEGDDETIYVDLEKISLDIQEIIFVVTLHEAQEKQQNFSQIKNAFIRLYNQETGLELARYVLQETFSEETAVEFGRFYRKNSEWRFQAVGQGYKAGLQGFVDQYYVELPPAAPKPEPKIEAPVVVPSNVNQPSLIDITKKADINLLKAKINFVLEKKGIQDIKARLALVLDISGSMVAQYKSGAVQAFLERIVPVAGRLDDNGILEVWFFGSVFRRTQPVHEQNVEGYIQQTCGEWKRTALFIKMPKLMSELGGGNNEPLVIRDVIKRYTQEIPSPVPTLVILLGDGGITDEPGIKEALINAAPYPVFWQFVGLAGGNYGILERLDEMRNRIVDNADFFHVDDLSQITDDQLYERLLTEFPNWLKDAKLKGILRN